MRPIRMALTKGRLEKDTVALFDRMGFDTRAVKEKGRRLILPVGEHLEVVLAKAADVITYVEHGVCDLGVVGKDTIAESGGSFYEVLDLGFGRCRFALAAPKGTPFFDGYHVKTVASKYPNVARAYFWPERAGRPDHQNRGLGGAGAASRPGGRHCGYRGNRIHPAGKRAGGGGGRDADFRPSDREYGLHEAAQGRNRGFDRPDGVSPR